uniref:Uncharacterized protein n=1 Tax=Arundo donax TaxID=35708 RepID=A0A0A8ZZ99_ARUDO
MAGRGGPGGCGEERLARAWRQAGEGRTTRGNGG